uniref:Uncharacterized protein n=1 Tax=Anguilla anguilla TaxID=7936 RepID=A0A0E9SL17_ANGAN
MEAYSQSRSKALNLCRWWKVLRRSGTVCNVQEERYWKTCSNPRRFCSTSSGTPNYQCYLLVVLNPRK